MMLNTIQLKKGEARRILKGHPWVYSNEINTNITPLTQFSPGQDVVVQTHDRKPIGMGYINPHSLIAIRLLSHNPSNLLDAAFFYDRLASAMELRDRLFKEPYYRLAYAETDGLPGLIVDRFAEHVVVQLNTAGMEVRKPFISAALQKLLPNLQSIYLRNDSAIRQQEGLPLYEQALLGDVPNELQIRENECHYLVPLTCGQKTGWFYDHRYNRARLAAYVVDKRVLDVFSYLGGFAIAAAKYGAKKVDCIEVSTNACHYLNTNASLNQVATRIQVINNDAFIALKELHHTNARYDVIILDPPAFIKKRKDREQGLIAYLRLHEAALRLLEPNGILISCSCSMHLSEMDLLHLIQRAAARTHTSLQILERRYQGPDHPVHPLIPEMAYLKAIFLRKLV